jgi:DNA-binding NarL/FixJ family response regulator
MGLSRSEGGAMNATEAAKSELLIVEDDHDFVDDLFTAWSPPLPVARASSGEEAFEYLQTSVPALVLLDLNLPHYLAEDDEAEGIEILSYIRNRFGSDVPVIIITRQSSQEMRSEAAQLGVRGFIPKPFDVSDLEEAIREVMWERRGASS